MDNHVSNLVETPWIPVRDFQGSSELVGLEQFFCNASKYHDLECSPHERISLLRLLICITQASLEAPETPDHWGNFGDNLEEKACEYLRSAAVYPQFNLFGSGPRFLQVEINKSESVSASKLVPHLASGNNPTLFDHEGSSEIRSFPPSFLALALLTFQCFYPLYGAGYKGRGPCVDRNMVHTFVVGRNLRETILSNCLTADLVEDFYPAGMGRPLWELDPNASNFTRLATYSYLGRLVPRHRNLKLLSDGTGFLIQKESLEYPKFEEVREPTATVVVISKNSGEERGLLSGQLDKAVWRDLHTIAVLRHSTPEEEAPAPFTVQIQNRVRGKDLSLWVGALVTDDATIIDSLESSLTLPKEMFQKEGRSIYEGGIHYADCYSKRLYGAIKEYGSHLAKESLPISEAQRHFWNDLELGKTRLLDLVRNPEQLKGKSLDEGDNSWGDIVKSAARNAYKQTCPCYTLRQHRAFAAGWKFLLSISAKKKKTGLLKEETALL